MGGGGGWRGLALHTQQCQLHFLAKETARSSCFDSPPPPFPSHLFLSVQMSNHYRARGKATLEVAGGGEASFTNNQLL